MTASTDTIARLTRSLGKHDVGELKDALLAQIENGLSQSAASAMISVVEALPMTEEAKAAAANKVTEPGYYEHPADGRTVKVQRSKKGYLYALELDGPKPRFVSGLISELDATRKSERPAAAAPVAGDSDGQLAALLAQLSTRTA